MSAATTMDSERIRFPIGRIKFTTPRFPGVRTGKSQGAQTRYAPDQHDECQGACEKCDTRCQATSPSDEAMTNILSMGFEINHTFR